MHIDEETGEVFDFEKERFYIDSLDKVEWYLSKINEIKGKQQRLKENFAACSKSLELEEKRLKYLFEKQFLEEVVKHIPKGKKSLKTLAGQVQFRKLSATVEIDEKEAIPEEFWKEQVKVSKVIDKEMLIKAFQEGKNPDGARYFPEREGYTIK